MKKLLIQCPLMQQEVATKEGYQRAIAQVPNGSSVLWLGSSPPDDAISLYAETELKFDEQGQPQSLSADGVIDFEFCLIIPGQIVPDGYKFRAPVRAGPGVLFVYEKQTDDKRGSGLILPRRGH